MRTVNFRDDTINGIAHLLGINPTLDLSLDFARQWVALINTHTRLAWEFWPWPELEVTEERAFRTIWNDSTQFRRGSEVFYLPTLTYYRALLEPAVPADPPIGALPTNATYWEALEPLDHYVSYNQTFRRPIGQFLAVYSNNPRIPDTRAWELGLTPSEKGIDVGYYAGATVWVKYKQPPSQFTTVPFVNGSTYTQGNLVYYTDGNCYRALGQSVNILPGDATYWHLIPMPYVISEFVKYAAASDAADDVATKASLRGEADGFLTREIDKLAEQGQANHWYRGRGRETAGGIAHFPWVGFYGEVAAQL